MQTESSQVGAESPEKPVDRDFLARVLGVDVRSVKNFVDEGMPKAARGRYSLTACVQWYVTREREAARGSKGLNDLDLARQRKTIAEARIAEIGLAEKEATVVPVEAFTEELRARCDAVAGALKAIHRYQPEIKAATTDEAADALLDRMEAEISAELYGLSDEVE